MLPTLKRLGAVLFLAAGLPACATITTGTSQNISVLTDPPGASCTLTRDGGVVGVVNPTPGSVTVSKSARDIALRCTRPGSQPGVATATPQLQAMTAGNILIGGLIGFGIDAASGALTYYPSDVRVSLEPETAPGVPIAQGSGAERAFLARRVFDERIDALRATCAPAGRAACEQRVAVLERERDAELSRLHSPGLGT